MRTALKSGNWSKIRLALRKLLDFNIKLTGAKHGANFMDVFWKGGKSKLNPVSFDGPVSRIYINPDKELSLRIKVLVNDHRKLDLEQYSVSLGGVIKLIDIIDGRIQKEWESSEAYKWIEEQKEVSWRDIVDFGGNSVLFLVNTAATAIAPNALTGAGAVITLDNSISAGRTIHAKMTGNYDPLDTEHLKPYILQGFEWTGKKIGGKDGERIAGDLYNITTLSVGFGLLSKGIKAIKASATLTSKTVNMFRFQTNLPVIKLSNDVTGPLLGVPLNSFFRLQQLNKIYTKQDKD